MTLDSEALNGLTATARAMLPASADPVLPHGLALAAARVVPLGLGDLVGTNADPAGSILGRRVEATLAVTVTTTNAGRLEGAVADVTAAFISGDPVARRAQGLLQVALDGLAERIDTPEATPPTFRRDVRFKVLYEHLRLPEAGEFVIKTIPTDVKPASPSD